jgi:CubicO group peptidase (beta-lactamase class C family)
MKAILMAVGILLPFCNLFAQSTNERIDAIMTAYHKSGKFDGAILVAKEGSVVYKNGFGQADIKSATPNQANTVFYIASVTKPFTAVLIMQLVEAGNVKLDNTLTDFFPTLKNEAVKKVTLQQLLSHTSGIPDFVSASTSLKDQDNAWFADQLNQIVLDENAGQKFKYANSTYIILAHIIERVTGKSYAENLSKNIFNKCDMTQSGNLSMDQVLRNSAKGYVMNDGGLSDAPSMNPAVFKGAGSIYSTVEDLFKFDQALYTDALLSSTYKDAMFSSQGPYGYGWFIRQFPGIGKVVFHEGDLPGYTTMIFRPVDKKYFIALLSNNQSNDTHKKDIVRQVVGILNE